MRFVVVDPLLATAAAPGMQVELWYDWAGARNLNLIRSQHDADGLLFDNERGNGSTYYYHAGRDDCRRIPMGVGVLRPDWLANATLVASSERVSGFDCERWTKADFITYWNRVDGDRRPVRWVFTQDNMTVDVIDWIEGESLDEASWRIDDSCFESAVRRRPGLRAAASTANAASAHPRVRHPLPVEQR